MYKRQVVQLATRQAQEIVDNATLEANAIKDSIMQYTDQKLAEVEDIIAHAVEAVSYTHLDVYKRQVSART